MHTIVMSGTGGGGAFIYMFVWLIALVGTVVGTPMVIVSIAGYVRASRGPRRGWLSALGVFDIVIGLLGALGALVGLAFASLLVEEPVRGDEAAAAVSFAWVAVAGVLAVALVVLGIVILAANNKHPPQPHYG